MISSLRNLPFQIVPSLPTKDPVAIPYPFHVGCRATYLNIHGERCSVSDPLRCGGNNNNHLHPKLAEQDLPKEAPRSGDLSSGKLPSEDLCETKLAEQDLPKEASQREDLRETKLAEQDHPE